MKITNEEKNIRGIFALIRIVFKKYSCFLFVRNLCQFVAKISDFSCLFLLSIDASQIKKTLQTPNHEL
ncbi:MAG: hypothetical protein BWK80_27150 [Desulfobacteraceae bacterium IS3]|nr:MAG: hypothetical protein BWK80_27150 [Desulfobacteraceae bacterium IS3]